MVPLAAISALAALLVTGLGLIIDMHRPQLDWSDPQRAMKGNLNGLLAIVAAVLAYGLPAAVVLRLVGSSGLGSYRA